MPAHLIELAPNNVRAFFGELAYRFRVLFGSPTGSAEYSLKTRTGYGAALASFETLVMAALVVAFWFGPETRARFLMVATEYP